jgi:L-aminopeptidase/D-esterase-like protein
VERDGAVIAGTRSNGEFAGSAQILRNAPELAAARPMANTTLVAIATSAWLDKVGLTRLARQAHDGLALAISPVHTSFDGDTVFALSTGDDGAHPDALAVLAVELTALAIRRAVLAAESLHGVPAARDLPPA